MTQSIQIKDIFSWFLMILFITIGILNLIYIHPVPFVFYLVLSLFYCPPLGKLTRKYVGFSIPYIVKIIVAFVILWATLAVGDLMEYYESYLGV